MLEQFLKPPFQEQSPNIFKFKSQDLDFLEPDFNDSKVNLLAKIGLIDYGMGNLFSVQQAFKRFNQPLDVICDIKALNSCDALILPGVGAFDPAMMNLRKTELVPSIIDWINNGKPLFGICLGLQLLFETSDEGTSEGLGVIKGHIRRLPKEENERIPHIGWSPISKTNECPILENYPESNWMYFVLSLIHI